MLGEELFIYNLQRVKKGFQAKEENFAEREHFCQVEKKENLY